MISRELSPVAHTAEINLEQIGEALAFSYIAYYNAAPTGPRPFLSYKRAWGFDRWHWFPREGVNPGFLVVYWDRPKRPQVLVAIEGTTAINQISPIILATTLGNFPNTLGQVLTSFRTKANVVYDQLMSDNDFLVAMGQMYHRVVFTGHSLGAAIADLVASKFQGTFPMRPVRCIKFGSPRVGNSAYVNRTVNVLNRANVYCGVDPIWRYPRLGLFTPLMLTALTQLLGQSPAREQTRLQITRFGAEFAAYGFPDEDGLEDPRNLAALISEFHPRNPWYDHMMKTYRLWFMNVCTARDPMLAYRFNYLEHPDENAWQQRYSPMQRTWETLDGLLDVAPDDVEPTTPGVAIQIQREADEPVIGGGDWSTEDNAAGATGGGDWGEIVPPAVTSTLPRRRFVRPRPS